MNRTFLSLIQKVTLSAPLINNGKGYLSIKDFHIEKSYFPFIRSSANLLIERSTFNKFAHTAVVISSDFYKNKDFSNIFDDTNSTFVQCRFQNCLSRAIVSKKSFDMTRVYDCTFNNCYDSRVGDEWSRAGGAVLCTNTFSLISKCSFTYCHGDGYGQAVFFKVRESDMTNTVYLNCHNETKNFDSSVYVHSDKAYIRNINITNALSKGNAGFSIQFNEKGSCFKFYHAETLTGQAVLTNRVFSILEYGNIINSTATHGLVKSDVTNTYISHYYFYHNHRSPLVSRHVNYLTTMADCIFCDVDEKPQEKHLAIVGSFEITYKGQTYFRDSSTVTRNYRQKNAGEKKQSGKSGVVFFLSICVVAGIFFLLQHFHLMEKIQSAVILTGNEEKTYIAQKLQEKKFK